VADKTRRAVRDALNGDYETVDPALRRALFAICTLMDEHTVASEADHIEIMEELTQAAGALEAKIVATSQALERKVDRVTKLLVSTTVTFVIALATGLLNLLIN
jgi:hypothetical protein